MLKKALVCVLTLLITFCVCFRAFSADIDGIDSGYEWDGATPYVFIDGESNCGVDFGIMKLIMDNENRAVYFCFMFSDPNLETDNLQAGISLSIENSDPIIFTIDSTPENYDVDKYSFEGAIIVDENNGATCEVRLGIKEGLPQTINGSVRFIDAEGIPSNEYDFSIVNEGYIEWSATEIMPTADNNDPAFNSDLYTEKTTKSSGKTTKPRDSDTKDLTEKSNRSTTTAWKYTTDKFEISTSPPYSYVKTTKPPKTTVITETEHDLKTTKKEKTNNLVTVYYYEKEVIISKVYDESKTTSENELSYTSSLPCTTAATDYSNEQISENVNQSVSLSDGTKYKYVIGAVAATLIVLLAAWSARGGSGKSGNESADSD